MKNVVLVVGILVAGMLSGCLSNWDDAQDARGTQEDSDVHMYDHTGEYVGEINTCPLFSDFSSPQERFVAKGIIPTPDDGIHTDGEIKIIDPVDFEGGIAVFSFVESSWVDEQQTTAAKAWTMAQLQNASAVFVVLKEDKSGTEASSCKDLRESENYNWESFALSQTGVLTVPLVLIEPKFYDDIYETSNRIFEIGPKGFERIGVDYDDVQTPSDADGDGIPDGQDYCPGEDDRVDRDGDGVPDCLETSVGLPTQQISEWIADHADCGIGNTGALVVTKRIDSDMDGEYQNTEITENIECRPNSPYSDSIVSSTSEFVKVETTQSECSSREKMRIDTITKYASGNTSTMTGTVYVCTGTDAESFEEQLKRFLCDGKSVDTTEQLARLTVQDCLAPQYEEELMKVIPQVRIQSVSSDQMPSCPNGGLLIETWVDSDGNGAWKQSETQSMQSVCNGIDGADGSDGQDGMDAYDFLSDDIPFLSNGECGDAEGGREVVMGRDINDNGLLDADEVEHSYSVCNGQPGENGSDGHSAVVNITSFSSPACNGVYVRLANGFDYDNDSSLSTEETLGSRYICLPSQQTNTNATFVKESIEPNSVCLNGGIHTYIWIDENRDNIVQNSNNSSEVFMESYDCAEDEDVVQCSDSDGDCISDEDDMSEENDRESFPDADDDGVPDHEDQCDGQDDTIDFDGSGIPDCLEDYY